MAKKSLHEITARLDNVFKSSTTIADDEIRAHFARYLCILASGYVEESIKIILENYVIVNASPNMVNYFRSAIKNLTNLKSDNIETLLSTFSSKWKDEYITIVSEEEKDAVNSVVANRNNISHGRNVGVSYANIQDYYKKIKDLIVKVNQIVNP